MKLAPATGHPGTVIAQLAARRNLQLRRTPAAIIPTVAMPVFFLVAFSGSFRAITNVPGFPTDQILNWMAPYAVVQGAAFAGVGVGFAVARDLETGFYNRVLLTPAPRLAVMLGPVINAAFRTSLPFVAVVGLALGFGARPDNWAAAFVSLAAASVGVAVAASLWGLAVVYRIRSQQAGPLIQVGVFVTLFLSIGQVPLAVMTGWLHALARVNPATNILRLARQGWIGDPTWSRTWPGLVAIAALTVLLGIYALRGFLALNDE